MLCVAWSFLRLVSPERQQCGSKSHGANPRYCAGHHPLFRGRLPKADLRCSRRKAAPQVAPLPSRFRAEHSRLPRNPSRACSRAQCCAGSAHTPVTRTKIVDRYVDRAKLTLRVVIVWPATPAYAGVRRYFFFFLCRVPRIARGLALGFALRRRQPPWPWLPSRSLPWRLSCQPSQPCARPPSPPSRHRASPQAALRSAASFSSIGGFARYCSSAFRLASAAWPARSWNELL